MSGKSLMEIGGISDVEFMIFETKKNINAVLKFFHTYISIEFFY